MKTGIMNHCNVCGLHVKPSNKIKHFQHRHPEYGMYVSNVNGKRRMFCGTCKTSVQSIDYLIKHYKRAHMGGHPARVDPEPKNDYTQAQTAGALKALRSGTTPDQVAAIMGAPKTTITRWQVANRTPPDTYGHLNDDGSYNRAERYVVNVSVPLPHPNCRSAMVTPKSELRTTLQGLLKMLADDDAKDAEIVRLKTELLQANRMVEKWKLTVGRLQEQLNRSGQ